MIEKGEAIGKYVVVRRLGTGGMGEVYLAWDEHLEREVAVKVMNRKSQGVENALLRFRQEARSVARLSNPHIVPIFEFMPEDERPYIVMEYVPGETLADYIGANSPVAVDKTLEIMRQALTGLNAAHETGILHRDIKPANMLISPSGTVKLMDFGLARSLDVESGLTADGVVVGTVHYLAPEVARGDMATPQSDLYSLGVTAYELLTACVPFHEDSPLKLIGRIAHETPPPVRTHRDDIPVAVAAWVTKLMAAQTERRYVSAQQALRDLEHLSSGTIGPKDSVYLTEVAETSEITQAPQAPAHDGLTEAEDDSARTPNAIQLPADQVEAVMAEAMRIQREGREVMNEDSLMHIAAEVGVSPETARLAVERHRKNEAERERRTVRNRQVAVAAAAAVVLAVLGYLLLRPTPHTKGAYAGTGGANGTVDVGETPDDKARPVSIGSAWKDIGITLSDPGDVLLYHLYNTTTKYTTAQVRAGAGRPVPIRPGKGICCSLGKGAVRIRLPGGSGTVAAVRRTRLRMAVMPFRGGERGSELGDLAVGIGDAVSTRLAQADCFTMIERVNVDKVIGNLELENSKYFDPATAGRIGKMLGVDYVVNGAVQKVGSQYRLTARRVEAETGKALETSVVNATTADLFDAQDRLAAELIQSVIDSECERFLP